MTRTMLAASIIADLYKGDCMPSDAQMRAVLKALNERLK